MGLTVHTMPSAQQALQEQRTRAGRWKMMLVLAVCAAPVIASYLTYYVIRPQGRTNYADLILPTRTLPEDLGLRTLTGEPVTSRSLHRQWLLLTITRGHCDADCEQRLYMQRQLHQMLGRERDRVEKLWLLTDDATPAPALLEALTRGDEPARILRAPAANLAAWLQPAPGQQLEDHLYVVDPMGEWMMRAPARPDPQKLKRDLDRLLRAAASWDTAGR